MCGIQGAINRDALPQTCQAHRGSDNTTLSQTSNATFTHHLHAVNSYVEQPLTTQQNIFLTNCEVYNADNLANGRNDAESLHNYLSEHGITPKTLSAVDGVYALATYNTETKNLVLARDILGVKPVWYYHDDDSFAFASEKKTLLAADLNAQHIQELHPRHILRYNTQTNTVRTEKRPFSLINQETTETSLRKAGRRTAELIENAVEKRIPDEPVALLFSGGVDSALLAKILLEHGADLTAYYAGVPGTSQADRAQSVADRLGVPFETAQINVEQRFEDVINIIDDNHYVKLSVALAFDAASREAAADGHRVIMSGTGVEELYGGYHRLRSTNDVNDECRSGLRRKYVKDLYRDDTVTMHHGIELRVPYLDQALVEHAMTIPHDVKQVTSKQVLRRAAKHLGLPDEIAEQPKKATQYGSGAAQSLKQLADNNGEHIGDYLQGRGPPNTRLTTLLSTGKDSCLATQRMVDYNYNISCFTTIKPEEQNSWMSHDANQDIARKQAEAAEKPLVEAKSTAEKEVELEAYEAALRRARREHHVEGVITGAVASEYQRQRIERICEDIGLKPYTPLWHTPGDSILKQLLKRGFDVVFEKTAAAGFDSTWIGKHIKPHVIEELRSLHESHGVHVAGEGGEFETVVLDAPFFTRRLHLHDTDTVKSDHHVNRLAIGHVTLDEK